MEAEIKKKILGILSGLFEKPEMTSTVTFVDSFYDLLTALEILNENRLVT
jgi:hypothetical protein